MQSVEQRLAALERSVRRWRAVGVVAAVAIVGAVGWGAVPRKEAPPDGIFQDIVCHSIIVRGDVLHGNERAVEIACTDNDAGYIRISDADHIRGHIDLLAFYGGGSIVIGKGEPGNKEHPPTVPDKHLAFIAGVDGERGILRLATQDGGVREVKP